MSLIVISVFHCVITAKLQEGGSLAEDKSQSDKNSGDYKKSNVTTPCQCVCHGKASKTTDTPAAKPAETPAATAVVDLTESPCKETAQPPPPAPEHSKYLSVLNLSPRVGKSLKYFAANITVEFCLFKKAVLVHIHPVMCE